MQVEGTKPVGRAVEEYLIREVGYMNIDNIKENILKSIIKEDELFKIHTTNDLLNYFKSTNLSSLIIVEPLKYLLCRLYREDLVRYIEAYEFLLKTLVGVTCSDTFDSIYMKIERVVEVGIGEENANILKREYEDVIDSVRELHTIQTVRDLFTVLEDRDVLNNRQFDTLEFILEKFEAESLKKLVHSYKTLFVSTTQCEICGHETKVTASDEKKPVNLLKNSESEYEELEIAVEYLCRNLGPSWKKLARSLKISEARISSIQNDYMRNTEEQIHQMFNFWRKTCNDASVTILLTALRSRICNDAWCANEIEKKTYKDL